MREPPLSTLFPYTTLFRSQLTILSKTDALDEEKWLNMLGTFVKDWFRYESHFVHGRDSYLNQSLTNVPKIGRAVQQECRDLSRMPSSAGKKAKEVQPLATF